jgi:hypothetical protein
MNSGITILQYWRVLKLQYFSLVIEKIRARRATDLENRCNLKELEAVQKTN